MKLKIEPFSSSSTNRCMLHLLPVVLCFAATTAHADPQDIMLIPGNCPAAAGQTNNSPVETFAGVDGMTVDDSSKVIVSSPTTVIWRNNLDLTAPFTNCSPVSGDPATVDCFGMQITIPGLDPVSGAVLPVSNTAVVKVKGTPVAPSPNGVGMCVPPGPSAPMNNPAGPCRDFRLVVQDVVGAQGCGARAYAFHVVSNGGGWGDPHLITVDGVHYDFQSAGEFTALRENGLEIQTRQTPVATTTVPGPNEYTGLSTCVAIYTAVAVRIGSNRVSFQPSPGIQNDASGMQLRVNGKLVTLTDGSINLRSEGSVLEGRISAAADGGIAITDAGGTQVVATPAFWSSQQKWYLNLNVYQTSASMGVLGRRAESIIIGLRPDGELSWLPALPDGTSLGPKPESAGQRYEDLYGTFADAWRVTDQTSLFDYAPGTNTDTFTFRDWPRFNPTSCGIEGQPSAEPTTPEVAAQACNGVVDAAQKGACIFDVTATGHTGFAKSYETMQKFQPNGPGWQPSLETPAHLTLVPKNENSHVGTDACVVATVEDEGKSPLSGVQVGFTVTGSSSASDTQTTDGEGQAMFCYTVSDLPGADTITATAQGGTEPSDVSINAIVAPESTNGCRVNYLGQIAAASRHGAAFRGFGLAFRGRVGGDQDYTEFGGRTGVRVDSRTTDAVVCSGREASLFGQAKAKAGETVVYRIDLHEGGPGRFGGRFRIRLGTGYDSGDQPLRSGFVDVDR